jgi:hypothetical protein
MTRRARSGRALRAIAGFAAGVALAGCIGQVSAHPIGHPALDAGPVAGAAGDHHPVIRVEPVTDDRDLDGVAHAAYLTVVAVPAASEAPPFVCEIMDMDVGATDDTPAADRTSRLLATGP